MRLCCAKTAESKWRGIFDTPTNLTRLTAVIAPRIVPTKSTALLEMAILWEKSADVVLSASRSLRTPSSVSIPRRGRYWNSKVLDSPRPPAL